MEATAVGGGVKRRARAPPSSDLPERPKKRAKATERVPCEEWADVLLARPGPTADLAQHFYRDGWLAGDGYSAMALTLVNKRTQELRETILSPALRARYKWIAKCLAAFRGEDKVAPTRRAAILKVLFGLCPKLALKEIRPDWLRYIVRHVSGQVWSEEEDGRMLQQVPQSNKARIFLVVMAPWHVLFESVYKTLRHDKYAREELCEAIAKLDARDVCERIQAAFYPRPEPNLAFPNDLFVAALARSPEGLPLTSLVRYLLHREWHKLLGTEDYRQLVKALVCRDALEPATLLIAEYKETRNVGWLPVFVPTHALLSSRQREKFEALLVAHDVGLSHCIRTIFASGDEALWEFGFERRGTASRDHVLSDLGAALRWNTTGPLEALMAHESLQLDDEHHAEAVLQARTPDQLKQLMQLFPNAGDFQGADWQSFIHRNDVRLADHMGMIDLLYERLHGHSRRLLYTAVFHHIAREPIYQEETTMTWLSRRFAPADISLPDGWSYLWSTGNFRQPLVAYIIGHISATCLRGMGSVNLWPVLLFIRQTLDGTRPTLSPDELRAIGATYIDYAHLLVPTVGADFYQKHLTGASPCPV